jgi:enoyl-CoA hydratase/carnithine racemase
MGGSLTKEATGCSRAPGSEAGSRVLLRKEIVGAEEAAALGLVNEVVDDAELALRSMALATELAAGPQVAMRLLKRATYNAAQLTFDQAGDDLASKAAISDFHLDAREGSPAFFEHRPAVFNKSLTGEEPTDVL